MESQTSRKLRIGTVAGLAALATQQAFSAQVASSISNISLAPVVDTDLYLDIDNDGNNDFYIAGGGSVSNPYLDIYKVLPNSSILGESINSSPSVYDLGYGTTWTQTVPPADTGMFGITNLFFPGVGFAIGGEFYVGISFEASDGLHLGYLQFYFPSTTSLEGAMLVGAVWETDAAAQSITIGAIPEPGALALAAAGLASCVWLRRRRI